MENGSKTGLRVRQAFVVTFALSGPLLTMHVGCKKTTTTNPPGPDPNPTPATQGVTVVSRADGRCYMEYPMSCPPGARCNPPEPEEIDCPPGKGDASAPKKTTRRPSGKEDWLRIPSHVYASNGDCSFADERFCAPPGTKFECTPASNVQKLGCAKVASDGATRFAIDSFVYKDITNVCHRIPKMECAGNCDVPEGDVVPCP